MGLAGFGIGALLTWPSAYTDEPTISMAAGPLQSTRAFQPIQASKASTQFLQPLMKMESRIRALPPAAQKKLVMEEKDLLKAVTVAGSIAASPTQLTPRR